MALSVQENVSLSSFNSFKMEGTATHFISIFSDSDMLKLKRDPIFKKNIKNYTILGGGTNILFTKPNYPLILYNQIKGIELLNDKIDGLPENNVDIFIKVGSGEIWHDVVQYCVEKNWYGLENLAFIPGTMGAAPIQNIGAYGVEIKDFILLVQVFDFKTCNFVHLNCSELNFSYRSSIFKEEFKNRFFITHVILKLKKKASFNLDYPGIKEYFQNNQILSPNLKDVSHCIGKIRASKLPPLEQFGCAGSFFKNPLIHKELFDILKSQYPALSGFIQNNGSIKISAAFLIDQCGLKNFTKGQVACYKNQPLVIVNLGQAKGVEVLAFSQMVQQQVKQKFGIDLEPEVNIL
ncbi:MAG: UDP-N-acetylmuramate dehydrogenase [Sediminibacterium sp.]|nr:UDP-N-acetylmuramate dehydrogenase [Sediminibacterium sp.]